MAIGLNRAQNYFCTADVQLICGKGGATHQIQPQGECFEVFLRKTLVFNTKAHEEISLCAFVPFVVKSIWLILNVF